MFCARCGQQLPEAIDRCSFCGQPAALSTQPLASSERASAPVAPAAAPEVLLPSHRVGGWLLFFCIALTVLWPLWMLLQYIAFHSVMGLAGALGLFRVVFGIAVGIALWMKRPVAIGLLRVYFIWTGLLFISNVLSLAQAAVHYHAYFILLSGTVLRIIGTSLAFIIGGVLYFSLSERVRTTYGQNLFS